MILLLALLLTQDAPPKPAAELEVFGGGGIEAPAQPSRSSSASVVRAERGAQATTTPPYARMTVPVGGIAAVRGQEENPVFGIGLVTGLSGTGDSTEVTRRLLANLLLTRDIKVEPQDLSSKNVAVVQVEALLPAGLEPGRRIDVTVSAIGDAKSLEGGTLSFTELADVAGRVVYATAAGPITVGGFQAEGAAATAKKNHVTVATLPSGGKVEREVPTRIVGDHGFLYLDLRAGEDSFGNAVRVVEAVERLYPGAADASADGKSIRVRVPPDLPEAGHVAYLHSILGLEIESESVARVVVNERTGVIVMGGDVRLRPGAIAVGGLTVTIAETPEASQPGPLSQGTTQVLPRTDVAVEERNDPLVLVPGAVTLQEVVDVLNVLGATPRDLISVLQAMGQGGLLVAEIRRM